MNVAPTARIKMGGKKNMDYRRPRINRAINMAKAMTPSRNSIPFLKGDIFLAPSLLKTAP